MKNINLLIIIIFALLACSFSVAPAPADLAQENLLKNSSFEDGLSGRVPLYWGDEYYNSSLEQGGPSGKTYLRITNTTPGMSLGAQIIPLDGKKFHAINVSAYIKGDNIIPGKEAWMQANLQPLFFDAAGKQVGGWPQLGPWKGTFGWTLAKKGFVVPAEAKSLKIVLGLYDAKGEVSFDNIQVTLLSDQRQDPYNLVSNGDFEVWEGWAYGGTEGGGAASPGYVGSGMLKIHNNESVWSFASQSIALDSKIAKTIKVSAFIKTKDVGQGPMPWQQARMNLEFKNDNGKLLGGWPIVASFSGSRDWEKFSKEFSVPPGTKRVDLFIGLMEVPGTIWADEARIEAFDKQGNKILRKDDFVTDTSGWNPFKPPAPSKAHAATDVSFLLDAPAGKHGFMQVKNSHFYFSDGTRARFWGTNIYAPDLFMDHRAAEQVAGRLARYGCNLVRIHHLDAFWADPNIFDPAHNDTQHFSEKNLEKLDYLLYQLKKHGIYVFMDLLVDRQFKAGDKVNDHARVKRGAKISGFFNRRIIALQKQYAKQLLHHYNPYTKMRYVDDPAIVSYKLINEAMLFYISTMFDLSPEYLSELDTLWNNWLKKKYKTRSSLKAAWTDKYARCDLEDKEDPLKGNVKRGQTLLKFQRGGFEKTERMRDMDTMRFYTEIQEAYFKEMEDYLKELGSKVPVSGSNHWVNIAADVKSNAVLGYVDRHRYWDHPKYGYGTNIVFENLAMVKYPKEALPNNFAYYKVAGVPFVVSEWNSAFPNEYRVEAPLIMAAYARLQDWDAVLQFSYNAKEWGSLMQDNFDVSTWPNTFAQWPAASLLFLRGDVAEAKNVLEETLGPNQTYGPIFEDDPIAGEPLLPLIAKTQIRFVDNDDKRAPLETDALLEEFHNETEKTISSDTRELLWDYGQGIFTIDTMRTQAAVGFIGSKKLTLKNLAVAAQTPFAALSLVSLSPDPIGSAKRLLLTVGARIENQDQKYNAVKTQIKEVGLAPVLLEGVESRIIITRDNPPKQVRVFAVDMNGNRQSAVSAQVFGNSIGFTINPKDNAMFYEIVIQ